MVSNINRAKLIALAAFFVAAAAIWGYQLLYGWPQERCEKNGGWFDRKHRECGRVVYIPDITGRYVDKDGRERRLRLPGAEPADALTAPAASR